MRSSRGKKKSHIILSRKVVEQFHEIQSSGIDIKNAQSLINIAAEMRFSALVNVLEKRPGAHDELLAKYEILCKKFGIEEIEK